MVQHVFEIQRLFHERSNYICYTILKLQKLIMIQTAQSYCFRSVKLTHASFPRGDPTLRVYHCSTGIANPVTWGQYTDHVVELVRKHPCYEILWYPAAKCRQSPLRCTIAVLLFHMLPAFALLTVTKFCGKTNRE